MQVHILSREMIHMGLILLKHLPVHMVDALMVIVSRIWYGDLQKYGVKRPPQGGPFGLKVKYGKYPVIDVGTVKKIKTRQIQVCTN